MAISHSAMRLRCSYGNSILKGLLNIIWVQIYIYMANKLLTLPPKQVAMERAVNACFNGEVLHSISVILQPKHVIDISLRSQEIVSTC